MAVDTRDKRASLMSLGRPWVPRLPLPDGGFTTAGDRAQLEYRYRGIVDGGAPPAAVVLFIPTLRRRRR